jgi:molybdate transport system substrate-binding protein
MSELLAVPGLDVVGPLPAEIQKVTVFSAGMSSTSAEPDTARALIKFLASPAAAAAIAKTGIEPVNR